MKKKGGRGECANCWRIIHLHLGSARILRCETLIISAFCFYNFTYNMSTIFSRSMPSTNPSATWNALWNTGRHGCLRRVSKFWPKLWRINVIYVRNRLKPRLMFSIDCWDMLREVRSFSCKIIRSTSLSMPRNGNMVTMGGFGSTQILMWVKTLKGWA